MIITYSNIWAQATAATSFEQAFIDQLRHDTSILAPGAKYMYTYKQFLKTKGKAGWNGRAYTVGKQGEFLVGMLPSVIEKAANKGIPCNVNYNGPVRNPGQYQTPTVVLRDYQKDGLSVCLNNVHPLLGWWPRGIIRVATGGGKTEMAIAIYETLPKATFFFVQFKQLLNQTAERFRGYGINPGIIGDGEYNPVPGGLNIATVQTVTSLLKKGDLTIRQLLTDTEQVFFDEAHGIAATIAKGNTFVEMSNLMPKAFIRWGLTATPFMRDSYSNNLLEGVTGQVLYQISSEALIAKGYLTMPEITMVKSPDVVCGNSWPECYDSGVVLNSGRNEQIARAVVASPKPCLIMCTQIAHAKIVERNIKAKGVKVGYLDGSCSTADRNAMIADLVFGKLEAIVCTTIFNAGVDIPQLQSLVMAAGGKSQVAQLQKLGRGLRRSIGKPKVVVTDFWDTSSKTLERHSKIRKKTWESEGFDVTIR